MQLAESTGPESNRSELPLVVTRRAPARTPSLSGFSLKPSAADQVGFMVGGRYVVEGFLGEGGTATVHLARDTHNDELVVVKRMKPEVAQTPELRERFLFEAHALSRVHHPSVIRVLDISDSDGTDHEDEPPFLVLEALRGESLGDYLKRNETMPVELAAHLMRQAAVALSKVHEAGLVHRDIKPDNLYLVGPIDAPNSVKVLDFGMAHVVSDGHDENATSILGTVQYMPPEQILVEPVDARTDIYALGVVMFRMVTGHLPFEAQNKHDLLRHQLFSPVPPASWLHEEIPLLLERIIHKATRKAPDARFDCMGDMVEAFDGLLGMDEPPESCRLSTLGFPSDPDIYVPRTEKGRRAKEVLAVEFGVYSRPHRSQPG